MPRLNLDAITQGFSPAQEESFSEGYAAAADPSTELEFGGQPMQAVWGPYVSMKRNSESATTSTWYRGKEFPTASGTFLVEDPAFVLGASVRAFEVRTGHLLVQQEGN